MHLNLARTSAQLGKREEAGLAAGKSSKRGDRELTSALGTGEGSLEKSNNKLQPKGSSYGLWQGH